MNDPYLISFWVHWMLITRSIDIRYLSSMGDWKAIQGCFYFLQTLGSILSIHLEWPVLGKLSGIIGCLLLDPVMFVSYHS